MTRFIVALMAVTGCGAAPSPAPAKPVAAVTPPSTGFIRPPDKDAKMTGVFGANDCPDIKGTPEAIAAFTKACSAHDSEGCFELGLRYMCGAGVTLDLAQAATFSAQACTYGGGAGCGNAATLLMAPDADHAAAMAMAQRGCTLGNPLSCGYVGMFYWQGIGVPADPPHGARLLDEQCRKTNLMACANLSVMLYMGQGVTRDLARAKQLAEQSCNGHMDAGCNIQAAVLLEEGGDDNSERAGFLLSQVCDNGGAAACDNLGQVYAHGAGRITIDTDKAHTAFKRACDLGNALGCTHLGQLMSQ